MPTNPVKLFGAGVEFELFGRSTLAYVRRVQSDELNEQFPNGPELPQGIDLWGLFGADGRPISVADEQSVLMHEAQEMDLLAVQRH